MGRGQPRGARGVRRSPGRNSGRMRTCNRGILVSRCLNVSPSPRKMTNDRAAHRIGSGRVTLIYAYYSFPCLLGSLVSTTRCYPHNRTRWRETWNTSSTPQSIPPCAKDETNQSQDAMSHNIQCRTARCVLLPVLVCHNEVDARERIESITNSQVLLLGNVRLQ